MKEQFRCRSCHEVFVILSMYELKETRGLYCLVRRDGYVVAGIHCPKCRKEAIDLYNDKDEG